MNIEVHSKMVKEALNPKDHKINKKISNKTEYPSNYIIKKHKESTEDDTLDKEENDKETAYDISKEGK